MDERELEDIRWMERAIGLAGLSEGYTRPNPPVGAVIVKDGRVIGEGRHLVAGGPHAEVNAFDSCRESARGATIYVTLEPCSTTGRTPPCTDRILREGVSRVVVGAVDENSRHCGAGLTLLRSRGIEVTSGVCEEACRELVIPFFRHIKSGRPYVVLKLAMTLDAKLADRNARSQWITGPESRAVVQGLRRRADVMLVGAGTVLADNPSLLSRIGGGEKLLRVAVDGSGRIPESARILTDEAASRTIIATLPETAARCGGGWGRGGARVWSFEPDSEGRVPLDALLERLGREENALLVVCEGGGILAGILQDQDLVDEYDLFYAPFILGDDHALPAFKSRGLLLPDARRLTLVERRALGPDTLLRLRKR